MNAFHRLGLASALVFASTVPLAGSATAEDNADTQPQPTETIIDLPCPLTPAQVEFGRSQLESANAALAALAAMPEVGDVSADRSAVASGTSEADPLGDLQACLAAQIDINKKEAALIASLARYAACLVDPSEVSCAAELSDLRARGHDLDVALFNLSDSCPWFN